MDLLQQRLKLVDSFVPVATVSMERLTENERAAAAELASYMEMPFGSLLRRADAVRLAGGHDTFTNCLREPRSTSF